MMISLYSQDKETVTIFETLKLFKQYIYYIHIYIFNIFFGSCLDRLSYNGNKYTFFRLSRETTTKKKKKKKKMKTGSFILT